MQANPLKLIKNPNPDTAASKAAEADATPRFITRQPILDSHQNIVGYELKLRSRFPVIVVPGATSLQQIHDEALLVSVIDLDFQRALGTHITFIPIASETLASPLLEQLPAGKVVICLDARELATAPEILTRCAELAQTGVALALDNTDQVAPETLTLAQWHAAPWAYLRLNIAELDSLELAEHVDTVLARRAPQGKAQIIATGVDTEEAFEAACRLPIAFFQGDYLTQVRPARGHRLSSSRMHVMEILNLVMGEAESAEIEERFKRDAALSYKLMRYLNSAALGLRQPVKSIGHALYMLGHNQLYRWLTLLLFASDQGDPRSQTLLRNALVRARFTENLGQERLTRSERGGLFIVGILSMLDVLLNLPMQQALSTLSLPQTIVDALVRREGLYAPYLKLAIACENQDQASIAQVAGETGISADAVNLAHISALIWSESLEM